MADRESQNKGPYDSSAFAGPAMRKKRDVPDGLWMRCVGCESMLYRKVVTENLEVCPQCEHHFRVGGTQRVQQFADPETFEELFTDIAPADPLEFRWAGKSYAERLKAEQAKTGRLEACLTGIAYIKGRRVALGVMDGEFLMGSMGSVLGEKITLIVEEATRYALPLVIVCMQMAKTSAALAKFDDVDGLYISILCDPTTGGTTASFAMLGDVIIAEPGALVGFAGQRVIMNTIKTELPEGFQRAEFLLEKGFVDMIVPRKELRNEIARLIDYCRP